MSDHSYCGAFYYIIGLLTFSWVIIWIVWNALCGIWKCYLGPVLGFGVKWQANGSWAIVTGASDGLGLEFAIQLASKGYNLLIISRSEENLRNAKMSIESGVTNCGEIRILAADLSMADVYPKIQNSINELEKIDVLVNNCGVSYRYPEYFTKIPNGEKVIETIMNVNVIGTTKMVYMILPKMVQQKRGIIINVSSIAAIIPTPLLAVYSASKAYVDYFTQCLTLEYAKKGVVIQSLMPGYVANTQMSQIKNTSWLVPSPPEYIRCALQSVGIEDRTMGYWGHGLIKFAIGMVGKSIYTLILFHWVKDVRRRYYSKVMREQLKEQNSKIER